MRTSILGVTLLISSAVSQSSVPFLSSTQNGNAFDVLLNVPPRYMWGWADGKRGYCGETSFQSFGIFSGNWISEEIVRQNADGVELIIGGDDVKAADALKFTHASFPSNSLQAQGQQFVEWCRSQIDNGSIVVGGFYDAQLSDPDYDHIMPVVGYKKDSLGNTLGLFYNDLWQTSGPRYFSVADDIKTRDECSVDAPVPQPHPYCIPNEACYGIALQGIVDDNDETMRMRLIIPRVNEPDWGSEDDLNQSPVSMTISAQITGLTPGQNYTVLKYESLDQLPTSNFDTSATWSSSWIVSATDTTENLINFDTISTDSSVFYRTVDYFGDISQITPRVVAHATMLLFTIFPTVILISALII